MKKKRIQRKASGLDYIHVRPKCPHWRLNSRVMAQNPESRVEIEVCFVEVNGSLNASREHSFHSFSVILFGLNIALFNLNIQMIHNMIVG